MDDVLALAADDASLLDPLPGAEEYLRVEMLYAATHEGALHLDDFLARRTRISIETPSRGVDAARPTAEVVADALGWDSARIDNEVASYEPASRPERRSQQQQDDQTADAARVAAPDTRHVAVGRALT